MHPEKNINFKSQNKMKKQQNYHHEHLEDAPEKKTTKFKNFKKPNQQKAKEKEILAFFSRKRSTLDYRFEQED